MNAERLDLAREVAWLAASCVHQCRTHKLPWGDLANLILARMMFCAVRLELREEIAINEEPVR